MEGRRVIHELAETLTRVIDAVDVPAPPGIVITSAEIDFPLEVTSARRGDTLVFFGSAPHSRWKSGFLPEVHLARLTIETVDSWQLAVGSGPPPLPVLPPTDNRQPPTGWEA